jgi:hypothetical protein
MGSTQDYLEYKRFQQELKGHMARISESLYLDFQNSALGDGGILLYGIFGL